MTVLLVLATVALFITVDWAIHRRDKPAVARAGAPFSPGAAPGGVFFAPSHTWMSLLASGRAWLGVDAFVSRLLEKPRVVQLKHAGTRVTRGEPLFVLFDNEHQLTVKSPIDAAVLATNDALVSNPELIKRSPYGTGWVCEIRPTQASDIKTMRVGEEVTAWTREELRRLRDVFAGLSPAVLQDGGPPIESAMRHATPEVWTRFQREFLDVS